MIRESLIKTVAAIALIMVVMAISGIWLEEELSMATNWLVGRIGFAGLCLILFVIDTLVTPFSPDLVLIVVAKSELADNWFPYVFTLGCVSVCAGMTGWIIGRWLGHFGFVDRLFNKIGEEQRRFIVKYGFWAIVLGAATPLPYSATCWTAGIAGIRWTTVLAASLVFRIPRVILYYLLISSSSTLFV